MSIRVVREKIYMPLLIGIDKVLDMYGKQVFSMPLDETCLPKEAMPLLYFGAKNRMRGLVVVENNLSHSKLELVVAKFNKCHGGNGRLTVEDAKYLDQCVLLSVQYNVSMVGKECWIEMNKFEYLDFVLCWHKGMFLPSKELKRFSALRLLLTAVRTSMSA